MPKAKKLNARERRIEKEILWLLIVLATIVILTLGVGYVVRGFSEFNYKGLHFSKEKFGGLIVYHYYYYFTGSEGNIVKYNMFLRNDPRQNTVQVSGSKILFDKQPLYVTVRTTNLTECGDNILAIGDLARFLGDNGIKVKSGNMDFIEATTASQEYVTCANKPDNDVVQIMSGNETRVDVKGDCATITIGPSCDMLPAIERFKIQAILDKKSDDLGL